MKRNKGSGSVPSKKDDHDIDTTELLVKMLTLKVEDTLVKGYNLREVILFTVSKQKE